jgi:hypothetical protein
MRKLIIATTIAAATLVTWSASANAYTHHRANHAYTHHRANHHVAYRVNPMTLARLRVATARLAVATYQLRYRLNHRHVQAPSRVRYVHTASPVRWSRSPLLSRKSG